MGFGIVTMAAMWVLVHPRWPNGLVGKFLITS